MFINKNNYWYAIAAILLAGLGIYYFLFERLTYWWIMLLLGALFNMHLAWKTKDG